MVGVANPCIVGDEVYDSSNMSIAATKYGKDVLNGTTKTTAPRPCIYKISNAWLQVLGGRIDETFTGSCRSIRHVRFVNTVYTQIFCEE